MELSALAKKLKLKPGLRAAIVNAPPGYADALAPLPAGVQLASAAAGELDWIQLFVHDEAELMRLAPAAIAALAPASLLWIAFPKGSSGLQTDLTRDQGWDSLREAGLKWVTLVSVNETWSAFALRPYKPGETRRSWR